MIRPASPLDIAATAGRLWWLGAESNMVMAMRMLGMGGVWNVTPAEDSRMWAEKPVAFEKSVVAATSALMSGKRPDQIIDAAIKPLDRAVSANRRRLTKRGPGKRK